MPETLSLLIDGLAAAVVQLEPLALRVCARGIGQEFRDDDGAAGLRRFEIGKLAVEERDRHEVALAALHPLIIIVTIALVVTFLTETTSNTATTVKAIG